MARIVENLSELKPVSRGSLAGCTKRNKDPAGMGTVPMAPDIPGSNGFVVAIPVFNEELYVDQVLAEAGRFVRTILVIDDGSTDRTPLLLRGRSDVRVITHSQNRGYGKSLADAFAFARREGFRWLITMDCDGQHEPMHLQRFIETAEQDHADIISGTRYPRGRSVSVGVPADRRRINQRITKLLNRRLGLGITDAFCGFKAYRVSALRHLEITVPGYAMPMQMWVQIAAAELRVREIVVPLIYNDPGRHFGGALDDPAVRLEHYLAVFEEEVAVHRNRLLPDVSACVPCP